MRYDVRVEDGGRFELERHEPVAAGEILRRGPTVYKVLRVLAAVGGFDAIVVVELMAGPAESGEDPDPALPRGRLKPRQRVALRYSRGGARA